MTDLVKKQQACYDVFSNESNNLIVMGDKPIRIRHRRVQLLVIRFAVESDVQMGFGDYCIWSPIPLPIIQGCRTTPHDGDMSYYHFTSLSTPNISGI